MLCRLAFRWTGSNTAQLIWNKEVVGRFHRFKPGRCWASARAPSATNIIQICYVQPRRTKLFAEKHLKFK